MAVKSLVSDTFEKLGELIESTAHETTKSINETFNPLAETGKPGQKSESANLSEKLKKTRLNHTPLNFANLDKKYNNQDKLKADALRRTFFNRVKSQAEKSVWQEKEKKAFIKQQEAKEEQAKKEKASKKVVIEEPKGKVRKSILSPKKTVEKSHAEIKPAAGKQ